MRKKPLPPPTTRWAAIYYGVSLLQARRRFELLAKHMGPGALRRDENDGWGYVDQEVQRIWTWYVDGRLHEAERRIKAGGPRRPRRAS